MRAIPLAVLLWTLVGCTSVPITGRDRLDLVSDATVAAASKQEFSKFMGEANRKHAVVTGAESPQAAAQLALVRRAADRVIKAAGLQGQHWEVYLVKSSAPNAFVTPDRKIVVFTGLLPVAQNEGALAGIIGHEVGHVIARHSAERMSHALAGQLALVAVDVALSNSKSRPLVGAAVGLGFQYGVLLPFSREHESEADHIGLFLMAKAGYDPAEFGAMWSRMEARSKGSKSEFTSTHPSPATRQAQITEWLPEAMVYYSEPAKPLPSSLTEARSLGTQRTEQAALAPIGERPSLDVGFWYKSRNSRRGSDTTYRVDREEQCGPYKCLVHTSDAGDITFYTEDFMIPEARSNAGALKFTPPLMALKWPLRVGDSWSQNLVVDRNGAKQNWKLKGDVVGYESVTVPAGTFMAFKVVLAVNGARFRESWWAPEVRMAVRNIVSEANGGQIITELVEYVKSDDPSGVVGDDSSPSAATPGSRS